MNFFPMTAQLWFDAFLTPLIKRIVLPALAAIAFCAALFSAPCFSQTEHTSSANGRTPGSVLPSAVKLDAANPKQTGDAKSGWSKLTPAQQKALQPLARSWDSLNNGQQRKWLEVSRNYPSLSTDDKANMHSRMAEWAALSNRERAEARLNFASTQELARELTAAEKKAKWEAYQSLSTADKKKLADKGARPPTGAATATQPVAQKKLATLPTPANAPSKLPKMPADTPPASDNNAAAAH